MLLHEIISISEKGESGILLELIAPYKKSLITYFSSYYNCEPVLIVTSVFNACAYGFIAPSNEMNEAIETYLGADDSLTEEDKESEREVISFNSKMLKDVF